MDDEKLKRAAKYVEKVNRPKFELADPNNPKEMKMDSGAMSDFAKAHNFGTPYKPEQSVPQKTNVIPNAEEIMRSKYLSQIAKAVTSNHLPEKKVDLVNLAKASLEKKQRDAFMNDESNFKNVLQDPILEREKREMMWWEDLTEEEAIDSVLDDAGYSTHPAE